MRSKIKIWIKPNFTRNTRTNYPSFSKNLRSRITMFWKSMLIWAEDSLDAMQQQIVQSWCKKSSSLNIIAQMESITRTLNSIFRRSSNLPVVQIYTLFQTIRPHRKNYRTIKKIFWKCIKMQGTQLTTTTTKQPHASIHFSWTRCQGISMERFHTIRSCFRGGSISPNATAPKKTMISAFDCSQVYNYWPPVFCFIIIDV